MAASPRIQPREDDAGQVTMSIRHAQVVARLVVRHAPDLRQKDQLVADAEPMQAIAVCGAHRPPFRLSSQAATSASCQISIRGEMRDGVGNEGSSRRRRHRVGREIRLVVGGLSWRYVVVGSGAEPLGCGWEMSCGTVKA